MARNRKDELLRERAELGRRQGEWATRLRSLEEHILNSLGKPPASWKISVGDSDQVVIIKREEQ